MLHNNIFNRRRLEAELNETQRLINQTIQAAQGKGKYPTPIPCLKRLEQTKRELTERIALLPAEGVRS